MNRPFAISTYLAAGLSVMRCDSRFDRSAASRGRPVALRALRWKCPDVPSAYCGAVVAGRAVPRAPSGALPVGPLLRVPAGEARSDG